MAMLRAVARADRSSLWPEHELVQRLAREIERVTSCNDPARMGSTWQRPSRAFRTARSRGHPQANRLCIGISTMRCRRAHSRADCHSMYAEGGVPLERAEAVEGAPTCVEVAAGGWAEWSSLFRTAPEFAEATMRQVRGVGVPAGRHFEDESPQCRDFLVRIIVTAADSPCGDDRAQ